MTHRFLWNFQIQQRSPLVFYPHDTEASDMHWEFRQFWDESELITLNLSPLYLDLAQYKIKYKTDSYYLLPHIPYNFKMRHQTLFFKPLIHKTALANAYAKKIDLSNHSPEMPVRGIDHKSCRELLQDIYAHGKKMLVHKEILTHRFPTAPKIKFELSKLRIAENLYYSICIESPSLAQVETVTKQLIGDFSTHDYATFLQSR